MSLQFKKSMSDRVLFNGKIVTVDPKFTIAEAVAIKDGKFMAVGSNAEIQTLAGTETRLVDLKGKTVIPGIIDTHAHISDMVENLLAVSISHVTSIADILDVVKRAVEEKEPGEWIITTREALAYATKEKRFPTRWELDTVAPNNPVVVQSFHLIAVNSYALQLANITKDTMPLPCGTIDKDPNTGEPTGLLRETEAGVIFNLIPHALLERKVNALRKAMQMLNTHGITSIVSAIVRYPKAPHPLDPGLKACQECWLNKKMTVRMDLGLSPSDVETVSEELVRIYAPLRGIGDDMMKFDPIGEFTFDGLTGEPTMTPEEFKHILLLCAKNDLRIQVHASHDLCLRIFDEANKEVPIAGKRWIALHCSIPSEESIDIVKRLDLYVVTQPAMPAYRGKTLIEARSKIYKPFLNYTPLRTWLNHGVTVCLGTDVPAIGGMEGCNPFPVIHFCVTRKDMNGELIFPEERITREEALRCYTINNAKLTFEEAIKGSIEPGKLADLVVLSDDILTCAEDQIKDIKPLVTMVGGNIVYER